MMIDEKDCQEQVRPEQPACDEQPDTVQQANGEEEELDYPQALLEKQSQLEELEKRYTRLTADFDNYRRRTEKQNREVVSRANERLICALLPVMDNFSLALESVADPSLLKGVEMIYNQLMQVLEGEGLKAIDAVECEFDPSVHEAVAREECAELGDNIIVEEMRRGYMLGDKVIRPSMVKVNISREE